MMISVENKQNTTAADPGRINGMPQSFAKKLTSAAEAAEKTGATIALSEVKEDKGRGTTVTSKATVEPPKSDSVNLNSKSTTFSIGFQGAQKAVISFNNGGSLKASNTTSNQGSAKTTNGPKTTLFEITQTA